MARAKKSVSKPIDTVRAIVSRYPELGETVVCARTAFQCRKKSFVFVGQTDDGWDAMVKLGPSLPEAEERAATRPESIVVGAHGWVTLKFARDEAPPDGLLERWIDESFRLLAPKALAAKTPPLETVDSPRGAPKNSARKSRSR